MLTVESALELVLARTPSPRAARVPLAECIGAVSASDVFGDIDMPPFDKSMVDGYAVRCADFASGSPALRLVATVAAGAEASRPLVAGETMKVMTGAPVPAGCDAVIMIERSRPDGDRVRFDELPRVGRHIAPRGMDLRSGTVVLSAGTEIGPAQVAALAAAGAAEPWVFRRPRVCVLATGSEIVDVSRVPVGAQIRNSNSYALGAQAASAGCPVNVLPPAADDRAALSAAIKRALSADVLILSGGVSVGDFDLVPQVLGELGVDLHAHKVAVKPGKPFLLGTIGSDRGSDCMIFGLPGNPVSAFVCFELFVRPALRKWMGHAKPGPHITLAAAAEPLPAGGDRKSLSPATLGTRTLVDGTAGRTVKPMPWSGSADLFTVARADALLIRGVDAPPAAVGDAVEVLILRDRP